MMPKKILKRVAKKAAKKSIGNVAVKKSVKKASVKKASVKKASVKKAATKKKKMVKASSTLKEKRIAAIKRFSSMIKPIPKDWESEAEKKQEQTKPKETVGEEHCDSWRSLITSWKQALKWTSGLDAALAVMLASVTSTRSIGDQLWIKVIGPASCGKSTLCEALSANTRFVYAKSTIRGFHSGWRGTEDDAKDHSLIAEVQDKTLVTKDGDTLLQSPNLGQILSEARDIYDSVSRTHYRHGKQNDYTGIRMTWILAGTSSLRSIDSSELGERFLDVVIMEGIDDSLEDDIISRVLDRVRKNTAKQVGDAAATNYEPELATAMRKTAGYVTHLRENAGDLLENIEFTDDAADLCKRLSKFVSFMRARPSRTQSEKAEREFSPRLASQLGRLMYCLAVVFNDKSTSKRVQKVTKKVAYDTARGVTLDIVKEIYERDNTAELESLVRRLDRDKHYLLHLLRFLKSIGVIDTYFRKLGPNTKAAKPSYRLTDTMLKLYKEINQA